MITFERVTITYPDQALPALQDVSLAVEEGELCLVIGPTGSGKSTLLGAASGLVPHFTGGLLQGRVLVAGRDTRDHPPRDLADLVGVVGQDPASGFVTDTVEDELAYGMEQLGVPPATMRRRVEETLDLLGLAGLRSRPLPDLSGGEQQRVAIGAVLTSHPRVLVLDEPTSALDPGAAEEVLAALTRLVHDLGLTVLLAEHRLERVVQYADRVVSLAPGGTVTDGLPAQVLSTSPVAPPIVELGRVAGWSPLPLSVRDARRVAAPLRDHVAATTRDEAAAAQADRPDPAALLLTAQGLHVRHGRTPAVTGVDLDLAAGQVVALMGRNGAGKTSLLWALQGAGTRSGGTVLVATEGPAPGGPARGSGRARPRSPGPRWTDPATMAPAGARRHVALVPQNPRHLLFAETVDAECDAADGALSLPSGATAELLGRLAGDSTPRGSAHPRDVSEGQRLALALAVQLAGSPPVLLLDEPTRGLDYAAKARLALTLARHAAAGGAVLLSSHDVEFVAECADRVVVLADGAVVADGPAREVLVASPVFAPQVARILSPVGLLTVGAVREALGASP